MSAAAGTALRTKLAFLCSGAFGFALYTACSLVLVRATPLEPERAAFVAVAVAIVPTFLLQKRVTFQHRGEPWATFGKYCLLQGFNACAISGLAWMGRRLGLGDAVNLVLSASLVVVLSWIVLSRGVFRRRARYA